MERFVIGAAILAAVGIAAGSYFGHAVSDEHGFRFEINGESEAGGGGGRPASAAATPYAAHELRVRNAVAVLNVVPEDRTDIVLEIANPGRLAMPTARLDGDALIIDGGIAHRRIHDCRRVGGAYEVSVGGVGDVTLAQMPVITVHVPRAVHLAAGGAVKSTIGASASADLSFAGCGDASVADVAGALKIENDGSGGAAAGAAQSVEINSAGSGDTSLGVIAGKMVVALAGSGGVTAASAAGPLDVSIAGSGDVTINGGAMSEAKISIAGSGDVSVGGSVQALNVSIAGSGDVNVTGAAKDVDVSILGSGDVSIGSVTGTIRKSVLGSGDVTVGR